MKNIVTVTATPTTAGLTEIEMLRDGMPAFIQWRDLSPSMRANAVADVLQSVSGGAGNTTVLNLKVTPEIFTITVEIEYDYNLV